MTVSISLITTTKNRPNLLLQSALSVSKQLLQPLEWIIYIDDYINAYKDAIDLIKKIVPQTKIIGGIPIGRAKALIECHKEIQGSHVGWLDDDDLLDSRCLKLCAEANSNLCYTQFLAVQKNKLSTPQTNEIEYDFSRLNRILLPFHFKLYAIDLYKVVGGINPELETAIGADLMAKMCWEVQPYKINLPLYYYRMHSNRMSVIQSEQQTENMEKIKQWISKKCLELV